MVNKRPLIAVQYTLATDQGDTGLGNGAPDWVEVWTKPISPKQEAAA